MEETHPALASPVRARIVLLIRDSADPVTAQQLADTLDLHVTTVRFHLEHLEQAGLVIGVPEPARGRGRPRIGYRAGAMDVAVIREQMIDALADAMADSTSSDPALDAGHRWAETIPPSDSGVTARITEAFTQLGFAPEPVEEGLRLRECPFLGSAHRRPGVICRVHLGLAQGLAGLESAIDLIPFDGPQGCLLTIEHTQGGETDE